MPPLPVIQPRSGPTAEDLVRLFHQAEQRWLEDLGEVEELDVGIAYCSQDLPRIFDANNVRSAALPEGLAPAQAVALVEQFYQERRTHCAYWVMNPSAPPDRTEPLAAHLLASGFRPVLADIMAHLHPPRLPLLEAPGLTIIPARASFRHARALAEEAAAQWREPQLVEAVLRHLDNPHWDALLALRNGVPVATAGVLAVGEVGLIEDVFVSAHCRQQGIGRTIVGRLLDICARALFRKVLLSVEPSNTAAVSLYRRMGFQAIGQITSYFAP